MQYFCVGMSLWDEERMKQNSKQARLPTDEVELPFCEGLEIISASQLQQTPAVLAEAAIPAQSAPPVREPHRPGPSDRWLTPSPIACLSLAALSVVLLNLSCVSEL